ncbi:MAG: hypothetical protein HYT98_00840 [Candidatus Sungbacteria bacterium]|nr:hypothetical protein [Candidatus Sungbacteria bacterium]
MKKFRIYLIIHLICGLLALGMIRFAGFETDYYHRGESLENVLTHINSPIPNILLPVFGPLALVTVPFLIYLVNETGHPLFGVMITKDLRWPDYHPDFKSIQSPAKSP